MNTDDIAKLNGMTKDEYRTQVIGNGLDVAVEWMKENGTDTMRVERDGQTFYIVGVDVSNKSD